MKRIKVRLGKFIFVSDEVASKVARATAAVGFTREEALRIAAAEPRGVSVYAGRYKPSQPRATTSRLAPPDSQDSARSRIASRLRQMLADSSSSAIPFDLDAWVDQWLEIPLAQLQGKTPAEVLATPQGRTQIEDILDGMYGGTAS